MSSASMTFGRPRRRAAPSLSGLLVGLTAGVIGLLRRFDQWLIDSGNTEPRTVDEVLARASRVEATDPGFAADLRAAALRADR